MPGGLRHALRACADARRFRALPRDERRLAFYAEDGGSWTHFAPIVEALASRSSAPIPYLTSSATDPVLDGTDPRIRPFFIGDGSVRTWLFAALDVDVLVLTMPDLETFHVKRSRAHPVHYAYVFHSMVSTHMIYRPDAFDHFDSVMCVGPHHEAEIRTRERLAGLPAKQLVPHGYGRLDAIRARHAAAEAPPRSGPLRVLLAPSWSPTGLLESYGTTVLDALATVDVALTVRPHPLTHRLRPDVIATLEARIATMENATLDVDMASQTSLHDADVMISDWSGAALEFGFGLERPVVFVDVPRKVNNPDYEALGLEPLEVRARTTIGAVVSTSEIPDLGAVVREVGESWQSRRASIQALRDETVFNVDCSGRAAADHLERVAGGVHA